MAGHAGGAHHIEVPHRARPRDADGSEPSRWSKWEPAIDAVLVAILAAASLLAAWSAYQAHHWNGDQSSKYASASALLLESARESTLAMQLTTVDVTTFTNYINAYAQGDTDLADFYAARFRPDFRPAFNAWMALNPLTNPDAPPSPFAMPEYVLPETQRAEQLNAEADAVFAEGEESKKHSEDYVFNTVLLATVLFFAGIAPRVRWVPASLALIAVSTVLLAVGLYDVLTLPTAH
jgi:hypothetical protein